jgi:hypothetical protein
MCSNIVARGSIFGTFYESSPIIFHDGEAAPGYTMANFTASTVPGCRTPHLWLGEGRGLYDAMGPEYTLLRLNRDIDVSPFLFACHEKGVPLSVLDLDGVTTPSSYRHGLVLSRPDQHVAWRGNALPDNCDNLSDLIRGATR